MTQQEIVNALKMQANIEPGLTNLGTPPAAEAASTRRAHGSQRDRRRETERQSRRHRGTGREGQSSTAPSPPAAGRRPDRISRLGP